MRSGKVNSKRVMNRTDAQLEGLKKRPDLEAGLPYPVAAIVAAKGEVATLAELLRSAKNAVHAAVLALNHGAASLRGKLNSNVAVAGTLYGNQSDEVEFLGGTIRRGGRRKADPVVAAVPKVDASPSDATSHAA